MSNKFDEKIAEIWNIEIERCKPSTPDFGAHGRIVHAVKVELFKSMPDQASEIIFRSGNFVSLDIGTAIQIQRSVILGLLDAKAV